MCHKNTIAELDNLAKQLWLVHRELTLLGDPIKAHRALDTVIDRLEVAISRAPQHHVVVINSATQSHRLALEAAQVVFGNAEGHLDPEVVAAGLLTVARVRLQQAVWALERAEWVNGRDKAAEGL